MWGPGSGGLHKCMWKTCNLLVIIRVKRKYTCIQPLPSAESDAEIRGEHTQPEEAGLMLWIAQRFNRLSSLDDDLDSGPKLSGVLWGLFRGHLKNSSGRSLFCLQVSSSRRHPPQWHEMGGVEGGWRMKGGKL